MEDTVRQFYNPEDDCIYFYDAKKELYRKVCDVGAYASLPFVIKEQIRAAKEDAEQTLTLPTK
jgi:hypothetical protein